MSFPIGKVVLWNGVYLQPFSRYSALSVVGSRV